MEDRGEDSLLAKKAKKKRNVGKSCVAYGCKQRSGHRYKQQGVTFHAFPFSKPDLLRKWQRAMHRKAFEATIHSRVCSYHFAPEWFDRTGVRVRLKAGAVPTIFDLPGHPVRHQKPPVEGHVCGLTGAAAQKPTELTTSLPVEHSDIPVPEPSHKCLRNDTLTTITNVTSANSKGTSNMTIPSHRLSLRECIWHNYCLPSPKVLKQHLTTMESALVRYKHKVKILAQKNRRLQLKVKSLQQMLSNSHSEDLV